MVQNLDTEGTGSPLASAIRHSKQLIGATIAGAVLGGAAGFAMPVSYTAETRLAVGAGSDSAYAIAGYPVAARELAQNYARWVQNNAVDGSWRPEGVSSVSATPIPESGVIRIETTARDEQAAISGADKVSASLMQAVMAIEGSGGAQAALTEYRKQSAAVISAQANASLAESAYERSPSTASARALATARAALADAQLIQGAQGDKYRRIASEDSAVSQLTSIAPAASAGTNRRSNIELGIVGGGGLALIAAFCWAAVRDTRDTREASGKAAPAAGGPRPEPEST